MSAHYRKIHIYFDVMNIYYSLKDYAPGRKIGWAQLFRNILMQCDSLEIFFYGPKLIEPIEPELRKFYDEFKSIELPLSIRDRVKIHIHEDEPKPVYNRKESRFYKYKDHCDAHLMLEPVKAAFERKADKIFYFTGDRDLIPSMKDVRNTYRTPIHIMAVSETTAREIREEFPNEISYFLDRKRTPY